MIICWSKFTNNYLNYKAVFKFCGILLLIFAVFYFQTLWYFTFNFCAY